MASVSNTKFFENSWVAENYSLISERTTPYKYGFNGQEKDDEVAGAGNTNTAEYWQYDTRLGRRWNIDPIRKPFESPYSVLSNNPIIQIDPNGDDWFKYTKEGEKKEDWHWHEGSTYNLQTGRDKYDAPTYTKLRGYSSVVEFNGSRNEKAGSGNSITGSGAENAGILTKAKGSRTVYNGSGKTGYHPLVMMINNIPIYIENRNGDTNASFNLLEAIEEALNMLERKGIRVGMIRIDAAGFNRDLLAFLNWRGIKYITRANANRVSKEKNHIDSWTEALIKNEPKIVGEKYFKFGKDQVRLIVKKEFKNGKLTHWGLATNETNITPEEIIQTYAKRGDAENMFSGLNQLYWDVMPKRKIEHNTVHLYVTALCYILFRGLTEQMAKLTDEIYTKMRFNTFVKTLAIPCKWLKKRLKFLNKARDYIGLKDFFFFDTGPPRFCG